MVTALYCSLMIFRMNGDGEEMFYRLDCWLMNYSQGGFYSPPAVRMK